MSVNALYGYLSHEHFYSWENANLELPLEIAMFCSEITTYFAVKFRCENEFASAQNLRKAVLCCLDIRLRDFLEIWTTLNIALKRIKL